MFNNKNMSEKLKELRQEIEEINKKIEKSNRKRIKAVTCAECGVLINQEIAKEVKYKETEELGDKYDRVNKDIIKKELDTVNEKYYCDRHEPEYDVVVDENKYYKENVEVDKNGKVI